ncbi:MAG: sigma-70 family RNA polymerase sigma factor [Proteobacteria bacterium]|nr:sigma-70 family RNA polymerase sigma factor [Pseudomonadota bacterium]
MNGERMTSCTDEQLMTSLVEQGDLNAFEELLNRYEKPLFNYILKYISDFQMAQDLFQETFYRIYKNRKSFNPALQFSTWAYRIATNVCIDELRKKRRELEVPLEENNLAHESSLQFTERGVNPNPINPSLEERLIKKDIEEKIKALVKSLPEKLRSVFILSEYQDLSCREIAQILEIPLGTVKSRLHNGFKQLVDLIKKKGLIDELQ